ncbi:MAG: class I SAM-dependent methyltransferase [Methylobacteriaceae bacterium]|nr:class I SAM-dependent methyltransferase [Methylobacteriaceae bacterium]
MFDFSAKKAEAVIHGLSSSGAPRRSGCSWRRRNRFAGYLADAVSRGVRQAVVLGAGLDTLSLAQSPCGAWRRMFRDDHPATQLTNAAAEGFSFAIRENVSLSPNRFRTRQAHSNLRQPVLTKRKEPAFFIWLGVVPI